MARMASLSDVFREVSTRALTLSEALATVECSTAVCKRVLKCAHPRVVCTEQGAHAVANAG
eukprot:219935-Rhodomonas_salina.1